MATAGIVDPVSELSRKLGTAQCVAFANEPRYACTNLIQLICHQLLIGLDLRFVELDEERTGAHVHTILHRNCRYHAPIRMLDFLHTEFHHEGARQHHRACKRDQRDPASDDSDTQDEHSQCRSQLIVVGQYDPVGKTSG